MKRLHVILMCIVLICAVFVFSACLRESDQGLYDNSQHNNEYNNEYNEYNQYNEYNEHNNQSGNSSGEIETSGSGSSDPAHTHSFDDWTRVKSPGCSENGIEERWCNCGEKQTRTIASTGHTPGEWIVDRAATCSSTGIRHRECTTCFETVKTEELPASGHVEGSLVTTKEATCTEKGQKQSKCTLCGAVVRTEDIPSVGGGHKEGSFVTTVEATCTTEGQKQTTCRNCGAVMRTEVIPAKGHDYKTSTISATCTEPGGTQYTCRYCGDSYVEGNGSEPLGHNLNTAGKCTRCNQDLSIDMRTRVGAPTENDEYGFAYEWDTGHLALKAEAKNLTNKTIKYYSFQYVLYNAVDDKIYSKTLKITGPVKPGEILKLNVDYWENGWTTISISDEEVIRVEITSIKLEYTDGTIEVGSYNYSTTNRVKHLR